MFRRAAHTKTHECHIHQRIAYAYKESHRKRKIYIATRGLVINRATPGGTSLIMQWAAAALASAAIALLLDTAAARNHHRSGNGHKPTGDISLWIDQQQIKMFSGKLVYGYRYYRATNIHPCWVPHFSFCIYCVISFLQYFVLFDILIILILKEKNTYCHSKEFI